MNEDPEVAEREKKDARNAKAREKRVVQKCAWEAAQAEDGGSEVEEPRKKKTKKNPLDIFDDDDDAEELPVHFTVYFTIESPKPVVTLT